MHDNHMEKKAVRTVRRKHTKDLLAVLSFLLLLPYTCSALSGVRQEGAAETLGSAEMKDDYVLWEKGNGIWKVSMEEFLVGALAASIPAEYDAETLKAQTVILRSICRKAMEEGKPIAGEDGQIECLEEKDRRTLWGEDFEENEDKFTRAVQETDGIVLTYGGEVIKPPYFRLSAGKTRDSEEIFGEGNGNWCQSVACPHDLEAEAFLQEKYIDREEFAGTLKGEGVLLPEQGAKIVLTRDSAGYVLTVRCMEKQIEGEKFRKLFDLPSSCFFIQEEDGKIILQTKGVGHGLGFDQYSADLLAQQGNDYFELLNFFFKGLSMEKLE